jgi:OPT family oligopeptide transporter
MAYWLPITTYTLPRWLGGKSFSFNPGPFNVKEHTLVVMMANVGISPAYGLHAIVSADLWYNRRFGFGFDILFILATQVTGFCLAGLCQRFVIWPASMIWPEALVVATNLNAFHAEDEGFGGGISRIRFLVICAAGAAAYSWLPGFLFVGLSWFSWMCWILPGNKVVNQLFGVQSGLGMGILTFDWSQIVWFGNPLVIPWWAQANIAAAFVFFSWIIVPIIYYTNVSHIQSAKRTLF